MKQRNQKVNKVIATTLAATMASGVFSTSLSASAFRLWPFSHSQEETTTVCDETKAIVEDCQNLAKNLNDSQTAKEVSSLLLDLKEKLNSSSISYNEAVLLKANAKKALKNVKVALDIQDVELRKKAEQEKFEQEKLENEHRRKLEEQKLQMEKEERERLEQIQNAKALLNEKLDSLIRSAKDNIESKEEFDKVSSMAKEINEKIQVMDNLKRVDGIEILIDSLKNEIEKVLANEENIRKAELEKLIRETKEKLLVSADSLLEELSNLNEDNQQSAEIANNIENFKKIINELSSLDSINIAKETYEKIKSDIKLAIDVQTKQEEIKRALEELEQNIEDRRDAQKQCELLSEGKISLDDVIGGNSKAKDKTNALLKAFERYRKGGKIVPSKGILFYGAPGTGKTSLAKAIAAEKKMELFLINPSMVMGENGERKVLETIELAKKAAQISGEPVILLIDEIDAIAQKRSSSSSDKVLVMLMNEVDKLNPSDNVVIIATTNRREALDSAIIRSGRIDQSVEVGLPNSEDKVKILNIYLKLLAVDKNVNLKSLSDRMKGFNGADIRKVVDIAISNAMERQGVSKMCDVTVTNEDLKLGVATIMDEKTEVYA